MAESMSNADNFWYCMDDPTNLMVIVGFMEFDEPMAFTRLLATIEGRLAVIKRFRQRVVKPVSGIGLPNWELDAGFDIRSHVHRIALPAPGDKAALKAMVADLATTPLDQTKPLWQVHLIENYGKGCAVFFRIHHCIADGIALIHVLFSLTDQTPDMAGPEKIPAQGKLAAPQFTLPSIKSVANLFKKAIGSGQQFGNAVMGEINKAIADPGYVKDVAKTISHLTADTSSVLARLALMSPDPKTVLKGKLGVRKCVAWSEPLPLEDLKTVGKVVGATLNDVLIAVLTGALRQYLMKRNSQVNELDLNVLVPVNIRKPGTESDLGNKFSLVFLSLPLHLEDRLMRLKEVKRRMDKLKGAPDALVGFQMLNALGMVPVALAKKGAHLFANKASAVLTNVPGPRVPLYFAGKKLKNIMFWVPRSGQVGMGISIISYNGKVSLGLSTDEGLVPDPEAILETFEAEFYFLLKLVQSGKIFKAPHVLNDRYIEAQAAKEAARRRAAEAARVENHRHCHAKTKTGRHCKKQPMKGSQFCALHQPQPVETPAEVQG